MKEIRRKDRAISEDAARAILEKGEYGVLATVDGAGQPYAVPISYIFHNGTLYLHCALKGHKLDNIAANPRVSFCVTGPTEPVFHGNGFSTNYESCVIFGTARIVTDDAERRDSLYALTVKYFPDKDAEIWDAIHRLDAVTLVIAITVESITGKARR